MSGAWIIWCILAAMIRPKARRAWLVVAAVLVAGSIAGAVALQFTSDDTLDQHLPANGTAAVTLHPDEPLMVWSKSPGDVQCEVTGDGLESSTAINAQFYRQYKLKADGATWYAVLDVRASPAGTYEMACGAGAFAVGEAPWMYRGQELLLRSLTLGPWMPVLLVGQVILLAVLALVAVLRLLRRRRPA